MSARSVSVAVFFTTTDAPGTAPPLGSVTVPVIVPAPAVCAFKLAPENTKIASMANANFRVLFIFETPQT
jgi:hypothetical protein